jgi:hypothetical protein
MSVMDAAEAQDLYEIAEAGRAAARTHQPDAEKPVEERYPDVLAALQWHLDHDDVDAGFRFANALVTFWLGTNRIPDGDDWFGRLLATPGEANTTRALALHEHGYLVFWAGDHDRAAQRFRESLDLAASLDDASLQALALAGLARVALYTDPPRQSACCAKPSTSRETSPTTTPGGRARCTSSVPPSRCPVTSRARAR